MERKDLLDVHMRSDHNTADFQAHDTLVKAKIRRHGLIEVIKFGSVGLI